MMKKRIIETKEIIERALFEWYFEQGKEVPKWKMEKNPQWWIDYLDELEMNEE